MFGIMNCRTFHFLTTTLFSIIIFAKIKCDNSDSLRQYQVFFKNVDQFDKGNEQKYVNTSMHINVSTINPPKTIFPQILRLRLNATHNVRASIEQKIGDGTGISQKIVSKRHEPNRIQSGYTSRPLTPTTTILREMLPLTATLQSELTSTRTHSDLLLENNQHHHTNKCDKYFCQHNRKEIDGNAIKHYNSQMDGNNISNITSKFKDNYRKNVDNYVTTGSKLQSYHSIDMTFLRRYRRNGSLVTSVNPSNGNITHKQNHNNRKYKQHSANELMTINDKISTTIQRSLDDYDDTSTITTSKLVQLENRSYNKNNQSDLDDASKTINSTDNISLIMTLDSISGNSEYCNDTNLNCTVDHTIQCVGDPLYCNYSYENYVIMLDEYIFPSTAEWILIVSHAIVFVMGLVGNALVCIAVYTNYTMRTVTNIFIVNLAVADFFVILFCLPPTVIWDVTETWFLGETMCKVVVYFQTVSVTVSVLTLTCISVDRWYAICFPLRYVSANGRAFGLIAFIWAVALIFEYQEFKVLTTKKQPLRFGIELFTQCVTTWDKETENLYNCIRFGFLYLLPLFLMTLTYYRIVRVLWKSDTIPGHRESRNQTYTCGGYLRSCNAANSSTMGQLRARRKAAKMLVAVVVMFAVCYFPVHLLNILRCIYEFKQNEVVTVLSLIIHWLCYANSAINPVIYNFMSGKFRREFRNALEKCRCGRARIEDRSLYHSTPPTRVNNISPSTRSNYQLTSVRDLTSIRERQTLQTSFIENGANGNQLTPIIMEEVRLNGNHSNAIPKCEHGL